MDARFALDGSKFSQADRRLFSNNRKTSRSVSPRHRRTRSPTSLPSTEIHLALSKGTYNLPQMNSSVFRRQQIRNEKPHTPTETYDQTSHKTIDMGRSNTTHNTILGYRLLSEVYLRLLKFTLLRSPKTKKRKTRYCPLEITVSMINYRTFRELWHFQQDLEVSRSNIL